METKKARMYELLGDIKPINYILNSKDSKTNPLEYWDEEKDENRPIRYAPNQRSAFLDEQDGQARLEHIIFIDGALTAQPRQKVLIQFLDLHPGNKKNGGSIFKEIVHEEIAKEDMDYMDYELQAMQIAKEMSIEKAEALIRRIKPNLVDKMDSASIKRDVRVLARNEPGEFMEMIDDPDSDIRNVIGLGLELGIIWTNSNGSEVHWNKDDEKVLMFRVPKNEPIEEAITSYFRSNPDIFKEVERRTKVMA